MTTKTKRQHWSEAYDWDTTHFKHYVESQQSHENSKNWEKPELYSFEKLFAFANLPEEKREKFQKTYNRLLKTSWVYWKFQKA